MKITDLVELVISDLQQQVHMPQNQEQLEIRKQEIVKRIDDLQSRVYIKKEGDEVEYIPV